MAKKRVYTGYAVVDRAIFDDKKFKKGAFGISLSRRDLETCKKYCTRDNLVVVPTYNIVIIRSITFKWIYKYPRFDICLKFYPHYIQLWWLRIEFDTIYSEWYERTIVYERPKEK